MKAHTRRPGMLLCWLLVVVAFTSLSASTASATVDYARQTGQPCGVCHTRPEGGGELTPVGIAYARGGYEWPIAADVEPYAPSNLVRTVRLIAGYVHLTVAVIWFGAIFYIHIVVRPQQLKTGIPRTEGRIGWISIGLVALTGIVLTILRYLETGSVFSGAFGTIFIIKLAQFGLMVLLALIATVTLTRRLRKSAQPQAGAAPTPQEVTAETLPSFDGQAGKRAMVAVAGKVYDVTGSRLWREGVHVRQHRAGQDLTEAMRGAPHGAEVLERMPVVGEIHAARPQARPRPLRAQQVLVVFAYANLALTFGILLCVALWKWGFTWERDALAPDASAATALSAASSRCIACHSDEAFMRSQIAEWRQSVHAAQGVGCYECHHAEAGDPDAMAHNDYTISVLVTPKDCAQCHVREAEEFAASRHAQGGDILESLDNILGEKVEGVAATVLGCQQCHGAPVEVMPDGSLSPASWPNTGIGRINPDGSKGACSTCHTRHLFSVAVAREADSCGNCHLGPDHPQKEIYEESKHGIAFAANRERMNLDAQPWVLGEDYTAAPTCATCHMSAVPELAVNHDVGLRIAWTLRPAISARQENWAARRESMTQVCRQCHSPGFQAAFFAQFDDAVALYDAKFATPASQIMQQLYEADKLTALEFDDPIEWTYFYLWHHEGRRARHGAAMMGPDYVQWHGFYEVADRFYNELVPQAEALLPGVTEPYLQDEAHQWRQGEE
ncbi:MAG: hypothetical protein JXA09_07725 [Anaerolineae bacterium]|nr:hypothetical protein [Anaerolineae bacterium]